MNTPIIVEPGTPEYLAAFADWLNSGQSATWECGEWDVYRLESRGLVDWPVGYAPMPSHGSVAMLELFRA